MATIKFVLLLVTVLAATIGAAPNGKKFNLKVPDECKDKDFCSIKPEGYDELEELINSVLPSHLIAQNVGDRLGDETQGPELSPESDWHNCPYRKTKEHVYTFSKGNATDLDVIIQTNLLYQPVEIVECAFDIIYKNQKDNSQQCFQHLGLDSFNMKTSCLTSTSTRTLIVYDVDNHVVVPKDYEVPCCCSCQITSSI